jgi:uncharacterized protein YggE
MQHSMKPVILGAAIALTSVALFAFVFRLPSSTTGEQPRTISVSGQASRKLVPDEAHLKVNLNSMLPKMAEAKAAPDASGLGSAVSHAPSWALHSCHQGFYTHY